MGISENDNMVMLLLRAFKLYWSRTVSGISGKDLHSRRQLKPGLVGTQKLQNVLRNSYFLPGP